MESIIYPLIGGVIIGVASSLMLGLNGRITGISGILGQVLGKIDKKNQWRIHFLIGLIAGGVLLRLISPNFFSYEIKTSYVQIIIAGLLVGYGTRLGSGCTSGHGVCGLPRFAPRSLIATAVFMSVAVITVYVKGLL